MVEYLLLALLLIIVARIVRRDISTTRIARLDALMLIISGLAYSVSTRPGQIVADLVTAIALICAVLAVRSGYRHRRGIEAIGLGDAWVMAGAVFWLGASMMPPYLALASIATLICVWLQKRWPFFTERLRAFGSLRIPFGATLAIMIPTMMILRHAAS